MIGGAGCCGCEPLPSNGHDTTEPWHRCAAFAELQRDWHHPIEGLGQIQHPFAVVLERLAADAAGLLLQGRDQLAVVEGVGQGITAGGGGQIHGEGQINLEPLAQFTFVFEYPHVGPQA